MNQAANEDTLDIRRKRLRYRASHRGTKEMDILLGRFVDTQLAGLSPAELDVFERLLEVPDQDLYGILVGDAAVPPALDNSLVQRVIDASQSKRRP